MSVAAHINHLEEKHAALELELAQEIKRPLPDFNRVSSLKKQKLRVKETIAELFKDLKIASSA